MNINSKVINAIRDYLITNGYASKQLSEKLGIAESTVIRWLNGTSKTIRNYHWAKLEPLIRPYLENSTPAPHNPQYPDEAIPLDESQLRPIPLLSFANAAGFDPVIEPFDDFAVGCADEYVMTDNRDSVFALKVDGDSMSPVLPHGSVLYVGGGKFPERGDIVVAKIRDTGQVVVKVYNRKNNVITLNSINPDGQSFEWNCKQSPGYLEWMYPVLEYKVNTRKARWGKN